MVTNCLPAKRKMAETPNTSPFDILKAPPDEAALVSSLRAVKNQIIGNHHKKNEYQETGLLPLVIQLAEKHSTPAVLLQVSAILYSMAAGGGTAAALGIEAANGPQLLCRMLVVADTDDVILGATRALKHLYDHPEVSAAPLEQQAAQEALIRLAVHPDPSLARYAIQILSVLTCAKEHADAETLGMAEPLTAGGTHSALMQALLQQLPRCLYANPDQKPTAPLGADTAAAPAVAGGAAGSSSAASGEANKASSSSGVSYVSPKMADLRFSPLRTTVLTAIDTLLRHHPPSFAPTVCAHLPDIAAAIRYTDADTRMSACALVATLLQPDRRKALQHAAQWPRARDQLFDMCVRGSSAEISADADKPEARDALVVSAIELAALTALIKLQSLAAMRGQVPLRLLELVGESENLQRAVADSNALEHLAAFILAATDNAPWRRRSSSGATANTVSTPGGAAGPSKASLPASSTCLPEPDADTLVTPSEEDTLQLLSALQCVKLLCSCAPAATQGAAAADAQSKAATPAQSVRNCCAIATPAHLRALSCCLRHPSAAVRTASAQVFQVMGRSTRATTKECFGDGSLATTLVDTLSDVSRSVQEAICFAICNLCATASCPARRRLLEKGVISKLAEISMSCEESPDVRLPEASLRALANAINNTTLAQRGNLMATWTWASARPLLTQSGSAVGLHTWELLQNLSNSSDEHPVQQAVLKWSEGGLLPLAHSILADHSAKEGLGASTQQENAAHPASNSPAPMDATDTIAPVDAPAAQDDMHERPEEERRAPQPPLPPPLPNPQQHSAEYLSSLTNSQRLRLLAHDLGPGSTGAGPTGDADLFPADHRPHTVGAQSTVDEVLPDSRGENATAWPSGQHQAQGEGAAVSQGEEEGQGLRSKVVEHALFVLSNLATGDESVISQVMDSGVPALLPSYLAYNSGGCNSYGAVRVAACWLVTNLTHVNLSSSSVGEARQQAQQRARTLESLGVLAALHNLLEAGEDIGEVLHRARNALKNFRQEQHNAQPPHDIMLDVDDYHQEPSSD